MSGALALIAGLFVTSCHDDDVYVNSDVIDQKVQNFRKAFKESFGSINPNQTWGFKQSAASATPSVATNGQTRNAYMNANMYNQDWDCVDNVDLTAAELAELISLFSKGVPTYNTVILPFENYWVQQVYKGTDTYTPTDINGNSVNGTSITGSNQMDKLIAHNQQTEYKQVWEEWNNWSGSWEYVTTEYEHVNNFNNGNNTNNPGQCGCGITHIGTTLMTDMSTEGITANNQFGFHESYGTSHNYNNYIIIQYKGEWYVGFDYEMHKNEAQNANEAKDVERDWNFTDWIVKITPAYHKGTTPDTPNYPETPNNPNNPSNPGHEDNTHTFVDGDTEITIDSTFFYRRTCEEVGRIFCEDLGVNYSSRKDFDYNDAVFDVSIMTRTEHCKVTTTTTTATIEYESVFVDSTYNEVTNVYDYNYEDIPIDTTFVTETDTVTVDIEGPRYFAKIYLYAAGGTIPLTVAGVEVHEAFGVGHTTMVNTRDEHTDDHYTVNGANTVTRNPVILENPNGIAESEGGEGKEWFEFGRDIEYYSDGMPNANDVPVVVYFSDVNVVKELESIKGDAPQKIKVGLNTLWASERCYFGDAYPKFTDNVKDGGDDWQNYGDPDYLYNETASISTEAEGTTETTISKSGSVTEHVLYNNPSGYDISRGLYFTDRNLLTVKLDIQVGDKLRFYATKLEGVKPDEWCIFLADGNSNRLHADQTSLNNHDYAEVTLTADLVSKLRNNTNNNAMVISGYGLALTKVTLIKK